MNKTTQHKQIYSHIHCLSLVWTYAYNCFQFISIITRHWTLCQVAHVILTSSNCFACKTKKIQSSLQPLRVYKRLTNSKRTHTLHSLASLPVYSQLDRAHTSMILHIYYVHDTQQSTTPT